MGDVATFAPPMDPFSQPFTLLFPDGSPFNVTMDQMTWFHFYGVRLGINIGSAIGATAMMLVALILLTKREKRSSPIFILNALALTINLSRCVVFAAYLSGPFQNPYAVLTDDWAHISALDKSNSIADPVLTVLLLVVIEASLLLQVKVILGIVNRTKRFWILAACGSVGLVAVGFRFAFMVVNIQYIMALQPGSSQAFQDLAQRANITIMVSLCFFTAVFVGKLGLAIFKRRQLGLKRFGPMQIVFIMGLQTLFVPTLVAVLQYTTEVPEMYLQFLNLITLSLPLSSLWAAASNDGLAHISNTKPVLAGTYAMSSSQGKSTWSDKSKTAASMSPMSDSMPDTDLELGKHLGNRWTVESGRNGV